MPISASEMTKVYETLGKVASNKGFRKGYLDALKKDLNAVSSHGARMANLDGWLQSKGNPPMSVALRNDTYSARKALYNRIDSYLDLVGSNDPKLMT